MTNDHRLLRRVVLRNYKSIAACDVSLAQLSFLVGPNGSGKSNFLDALRFIADALRFSVDHALRDRGGLPVCLNHGVPRLRRCAPWSNQPEVLSSARSRARARTRCSFGPRLSSPLGRNRMDATRIAP